MEFFKPSKLCAFKEYYFKVDFMAYIRFVESYSSATSGLPEVHFLHHVPEVVKPALPVTKWSD